MNTNTNQANKYKITFFYCINTFNKSFSSFIDGGENYEVKAVKMACSGMTKDVYLLRAFEAGADAVVVLVCPEGHCRYTEGNLRAKKRVAWVKNLLDEIGLDGRRLSIFNISPTDKTATEKIIQEILKTLKELGHNPAA